MRLVDLHVHTNYSDDADYSPREIIEKAQAKNLSCIAFTDHNTTAAIEEGLELTDNKKLELVPGIEIDTDYKGVSLHILGYYLDWEAPEIGQLLAGLRSAQHEQFKQRIRELQKLDFQITVEEVKENLGERSHPPGGLIAKVLLAKPENQLDKRLQPYLTGEKSDQPYFNFYLDYFQQGGKAYVPRWQPDAEKTIQVINNLGGVPVLAHPGANLDQEREELIEELVQVGLQGIEAHSTYHTQREVEVFKQLAKKYDLVITAGSDFHGELKPEIELGEIEENKYQIVAQLKQLRGD